MNRPLFRLHPVGKMIVSALLVAFAFATWDLRKLALLCGIALLLILFDVSAGTFRALLTSLLVTAIVSGIARLMGNTVIAAAGLALHLAMMLFAAVYMSSTQVAELLRGFSSCGLPDQLLLGFLIVFRFFDVLKAEWLAILQAGTMLPRGGIHPIKKLYRCVIVPFVYRLFSLSDELAISVESRGFGAARRSRYKENKIRVTDTVLFFAVVVSGVVVLCTPLK